MSDQEHEDQYRRPRILVDPNGTEGQEEDLLKMLLDSEKKLREVVEGDEIKFVPPLVKKGDKDLFYANSLNIVQGKYGTFKSRYTGDIASLLIHKEAKANLSGMTRVSLYQKYVICYSDTERNHKDQYPFAIQQIILRAGYTLKAPPKRLRYNSFIDVPRDKRQKALEAHVNHMRGLYPEDHLVFVIDVATDMLGDFNQVSQTYELIDYLNVLINSFDITFFLVIHENPNSDKARGHAGTEAGNKASSLVSVGFDGETQILKLQVKKVRFGPAGWDWRLKYDNETGGLVEASGEDVAASKAKKPDLEVPLSEILDMMAKAYLDKGALNKGKLITAIAEEFRKAGLEVSERTVERRFGGITEKYSFVTEGVYYRVKIKQQGSSKIYSLVVAGDDDKISDDDLPF